MNALLAPKGHAAPGRVAPFTPLMQGAHRVAVRAPTAELRASSSLPRSQRDRSVMAQAAVATKERTAATNVASPVDAPFDVSRTLLLQGGPLCFKLPGRVRSPLRSRCVRTAGEKSQIDADGAINPEAPELPAGFPFKLLQPPQHGFGWDSCDKGNWYKQVQDKIPEIKEAGFTHVWLPPPSESVAKQGYLPGQLYKLDSSYGNKEQLQELTAALKAAGLRPIADIVINHRCADQQDENGIWNMFKDDVEHPGESVAWGQWAITSNDPDFRGRGATDSGEDYGPAPDLDHTNDQLRKSLKDWMRWLKSELGFDSFRFDFAKGFAASYVAEYLKDTGTAEKFNVGEYWVDLRWEGSNLAYDQNGPRQILVDWISGTGKTSTAFDFPTKGILQEAVKNCEYWRLIDHEGRPPGLMGWWPSKATTFIDNHDTGSTQQHWPFPGGKELVGYAYLFTHPGMPCVFWDHLFQYPQQIKDLIALRREADLHARSSVVINIAEGDVYIATIDDKVKVKLGPRYDMGEHAPKEEEGWKIRLHGDDWAVWLKQ